MLVTCGYLVYFEVEIIEMQRWWTLILNGTSLAL